MLISHHDQVPVLVGANPTIKALIAFGDALVSRIMVSVGRLRICMILGGELVHKPHAPEMIGEVEGS